MLFFGPHDLAIDIGTSTIRVAGRREGISYQPAVLRDVSALNRGVIVNPRAVTGVLGPMMRQRGRLSRPRVLACAPSDVTVPERHLVRSCVMEAGASLVIVVPEPLAAAVGAGIDIGCRFAKFLVDFGEGVTDCAIFRNGRIIASHAERTGCSDLRSALRSHLRRTLRLEITAAEGDALLRRVGLRRTGQEILTCSPNGQPVTVAIPLAPLHEELRPVLDRMLSPIRILLGKVPANIGAEVIEDGISLSGGGSLLQGLREAVAEQSRIATKVVPDPLGSVVRGGRRMLPFADSLDLWKSWTSLDRH